MGSPAHNVTIISRITSGLNFPGIFEKPRRANIANNLSRKLGELTGRTKAALADCAVIANSADSRQKLFRGQLQPRAIGIFGGEPVTISGNSILFQVRYTKIRKDSFIPGILNTFSYHPAHGFVSGPIITLVAPQIGIADRIGHAGI